MKMNNGSKFIYLVAVNYFRKNRLYWLSYGNMVGLEGFLYQCFG